jgi:membrane fusion protein, multidrug efflux system
MHRITKRSLAVLCLLVSAIVGGYGYWHFSHAHAQARQKAPGRPGGNAAAPTAVAVSPAAIESIDLITSALGTVTPLRTVTVHTRVDGELLRVHFKEGQTVKEGELLAEIDPRSFQIQLAQAQAQLVHDQALLDNARRDLERYKTLIQQDSIPRQEYETQVALVRQYEGTVAVDRSQIDTARLQLVYSRITAPVSGRVGLRLVDPGNIVQTTDTTGLFVITQLEPIAVVFSVPQDVIPAVMKRMGGAEPVRVEAWDRAQKTKLAAGVLASVDNQIDTTTGTVKLKAQFENADAALFPNQFVNARMPLDTQRDAVVIPSAAVQRGAQGPFVYVVRQDHTVQQRTLRLGTAQGDRVAVAEGLAAGELVVTDGLDRLRPGARVEPHPQ